MRNTQPHIFAMSLFKLIEEKSMSLKTEKKRYCQQTTLGLVLDYLYIKQNVHVIQE